MPCACRLRAVGLSGGPEESSGPSRGRRYRSSRAEGLRHAVSVRSTRLARLAAQDTLPTLVWTRQEDRAHRPFSCIKEVRMSYPSRPSTGPRRTRSAQVSRGPPPEPHAFCKRGSARRGALTVSGAPRPSEAARGRSGPARRSNWPVGLDSPVPGSLCSSGRRTSGPRPASTACDSTRNLVGKEKP